MQFAAHPLPDPEQAPFLNQAHIAVNARGEVAMGFIYPYKLVFFSRAGYPRFSILIHPKFLVAPPTFQKEKGKILRMVRQSIIYDVHWFGRRLYVLVTPEQAQAASYMDVFSPKGTFLERFYLPLNALKMTHLGNLLYFLGYWPKYGIDAYRIVRIRGEA